jgi:hypothetical protein
MNSTFRSWGGPVGRHIDKRARTLSVKAKAVAPKDTGALTASIVVENAKHGRELEAQVGTYPGLGGKRGYAYFQHEGTKPHVIRPRYAQALRFKIGGIIVFAKKVNHPGFGSTKFLSRWLREVVK